MMRQSTYHQLLHGTLLCILAQLPYVAPVVVMPSAVGQAAMGSGIKHHAHTQVSHMSVPCKMVCVPSAGRAPQLMVAVMLLRSC